MKNLVFILNTQFPYGEAFSSRARNFVKLFNQCGFHTHIIALESQVKDCDELNECNYSIEYVHDPKNTISMLGIGTARPYMQALESYGNKEGIDIIFSRGMVYVTDDIYRYAHRRNIPYYIEQCEWYDASIFKFGKYNPYYREHIKLIESKNKRVDGVVAISRLFENHYKNMGVRTVRIPTILDVKNEIFRKEYIEKESIHIVFAGSLGKGKEKLKNIFCALEKINKQKMKIVLDIYGASEKQVLENIGNNHDLFQTIKRFVFIHGRIPQNEVPNRVRDADFTIFIRPKRKSSDAGFPTKLAESLTVGTPVITNLTGDIGLYLSDGENGFLVSDDTEDQLINMFQKITRMKTDELSKMREKARKSAEQNFDFREYTDNIKALFYSNNG